MAHTYTSLRYHFVFSTAGRRNLVPQDNLSRLHAYMGGIVGNLKGTAISVGGTANHAHVLAILPPTFAPAKAVGAIKANSSGWAHVTFPTMADFRSQEGYAAFTVSRSQSEKVAVYIQNQAAHHETQTFEEELIAFYERHGIDYDPRFVFD